MNRWIAMALLGTLFVAGCSNNPNSNDDQNTAEQLKTQATYAQDIAGDWIGPCEANPDPNFAAGSVKLHITFDYPNFNENYYAYSANDCSGSPIYFLRDVGSFTILDPRNTTNPAAVRKINLSRNFVGLTPEVGSLVDQLNTNKTCGDTNWMIDKEGPLSNHMCWGTEAYPAQTTYQVFALLEDDTQFCFGKIDSTLDGSQPSTRPTDVGTCYGKATEGTN